MKKILFALLIFVAIICVVVIVGIKSNWTADKLIGVFECDYSLEGASPNKKFGQSDITAPKQVIKGCTFLWQCENLVEDGRNYCYYSIAQERRDVTVCEKISDSTKDKCIKNVE